MRRMDGRVFLVCLGVALLLPMHGVSAWSNRTYTYVCDEAVKYVWGSEVLEKCVYTQDIQFQKDFCGMLTGIAGEEAYQSCIKDDSLVHPALMSVAFFNDPQLHRDYTTCPIRSEPDAKQLCSADKNSPAMEQAVKWFTAAEKAADECTRVYAFCIGSNYVADAYNPLNHILYGVDKGECSEILDKKVDLRLAGPSPAGWGITQVCSFKYMQEKTGQTVPQRYAQDFGVSNKTFVDLTANLTAYAGIISKIPYPTTTTTAVTTTEMAVTMMTVVTTIPTSTSTAPTTTMTEESGGGGSGLLYLLVLVCVLAVIGYAGGQFKPKSHTPKLKTQQKEHSHHGVHKHAQMTSLRQEGLDESIIEADRAHSRLGKVSGGAEED